MMKKAFILLYIVFFAMGKSNGQQRRLDSLQGELHHAKNDTDRANALNFISTYYDETGRRDSSIYYATQAIELSGKINYTYGSYLGYSKLAFVLNTTGNFSKAIEMGVKSLKYAEQLKKNRKLYMAASYMLIGGSNRRMGFDSAGLSNSLKAIQLYNQGGAGKWKRNFGPYFNTALVYSKLKKLDSAIYYARMSYDITTHYAPQNQGFVPLMASTLATVYAETNLDSARKYFSIGLSRAKKGSSPLANAQLFNDYARFLKKTNQPDSCIYYAAKALVLCQQNNFDEHAAVSASLLTDAYELQHQPDSALKYLKVLSGVKDSIFNSTKLENFQLVNFEEGQRQKDIDIAKERYRNKVRFYSMVAAIGIFLLLVIILYRNNRQKQKAKNSIEKAYGDLKTTQAQLVQSEKMASLGELTAGIAHEIQNPLNFVNNFSEVNKELISELVDEADKGNTNEVKLIAADIKENSEKINHHGKRADAIVKGMLQHSRVSTGQKELTDINALCDEYLRLVYHGLRAKDKSFNSEIKTQFDSSVGKINIVPQDIGRVVLNLINNAFYAVNEKQKQNLNGYEPTVTFITKSSNGVVEVKVKDNGNGIPQRMLDKIFQPFFTTKPTGQGTGLGLSLAYDIIKAHGGDIKVETKEGEGSVFVIQLPVG